MDATNAGTATYTGPKTRRAGTVLITLARTGSGTFTVTCEQGGTLRLDAEDWCRAYPTYQEARHAANHAHEVLSQFDNVWAWKARREQLRQAIEEQFRRQSRRMHDRAVLKAAQAEYDTLASLTDLATRDALEAHLEALRAHFDSTAA